MAAKAAAGLLQKKLAGPRSRLRHSQGDGEWEHDRGVSIETLDNPGWLGEINLQGTNVEGVEFPEIRELEPRRRWLACKVTEQQFEGAGGPHMLGEILASFVHWARNAERSS